MDHKEFMQNRIAAQADIRTVDVILASIVGLEKSMILSRMLYLCRDGSEFGKEIDGERWICNTGNDWTNQYDFPWLSLLMIKRYIVQLTTDGYLLTRQEKGSTNRTKYYKPDYTKLVNAILPNRKMPSYQIVKCILPNRKMPANEPTIYNELKVIKDLKTVKIKDLKIKDSSEATNKPPKPRDPYFDAVAEVCQYDPKLVGSRIAKASNALKKAGYLPEDILNFLEYWKATNYAWKQIKQLPAAEQIVSGILRSKSWYSTHGTGQASSTADDGTFWATGSIPGEDYTDYIARMNKLKGDNDGTN